MDFQITAEARDLQARARRLAEDFASRAATNDREASSPMENFAALRREGFCELNVPKDRGGAGIGLLPWSLAAEDLAQARMLPPLKRPRVCAARAGQIQASGA